MVRETFTKFVIVVGTRLLVIFIMLLAVMPGRIRLKTEEFVIDDKLLFAKYDAANVFFCLSKLDYILMRIN